MITSVYTFSLIRMITSVYTFSLIHYTIGGVIPAGKARYFVSIPGIGERFFSPPKRPERPWVPSSLLLEHDREFSPHIPSRRTQTRILSYGATSPGGPGPSHYRGFTITLRHTPHSVGLLRTLISPTQRTLPNNTQHSKETDLHAPVGIRTHNPSKRLAADPRLRTRGHWGRQTHTYL
jgi:hypothetical protein